MDVQSPVWHNSVIGQYLLVPELVQSAKLKHNVVKKIKMLIRTKKQNLTSFFIVLASGEHYLNIFLRNYAGSPSLGQFEI